MLLTQSNCERKAHPEGRQKAAPFSVSQLSPPPHHVFPKPGPVPGAKCTGKRILGPAVIWARRWPRVNQKPTDRPRNNVAPCRAPESGQLRHPPASRPAAERDARRAPATCPAWSFRANPVLNCSYFLFWMTRSLCCERRGWTASHGLILVFLHKPLRDSRSSSVWAHGSSGIPRAGNLPGSFSPPAGHCADQS